MITITQLLTKFENKTKNFALKAVEDYTELPLLKWFLFPPTFYIKTLQEINAAKF